MILVCDARQLRGYHEAILLEVVMSGSFAVAWGVGWFCGDPWGGILGVFVRLSWDCCGGNPGVSLSEVVTGLSRGNSERVLKVTARQKLGDKSESIFAAVLR